MARSKPQLVKSRDRLRAIIEGLREELREIDEELQGYERGVPLNDVFFLENIIPMLAKANGGLTSADIKMKLEGAGYAINAVSLRTFLSRNKSRGRLVTLDTSIPTKWQVSPSFATVLAGLGIRIVEQPPEWRAKHDENN